MLHTQRTINVRGKLLDLDKPVIMGILNVTPDSFYDGGRYNGVVAAVAQASKMYRDGAQIIDLGGMSSRPGAAIVSPEEEANRVLPVIRELVKSNPEMILSIDTLHSKTADLALEAGAAIVNDISGGRYDAKIVEVAARYGAPFICMHMQGLPHNMQKEPHYEDVTQDVLEFFTRRIGELRNAGINDIIIDPGFGFGKTVDHNYELLGKLGILQMLELPILVGISRKSMICRVLDVKPEEALNGTTALHMLALQQGASILRVHDVKEAKETIDLYLRYARVNRNSESGFRSV